MRSFTDVEDALDAAGVEHEIVQLTSSSHTAQEAAEALGVPVAEVVKSLVFLADGRPLLALVPGDARVDAEALACGVGATDISFARAREVLELTGYKPGAVPPVGLTTRLPVVADPRVFAPEVVYCGGGTTTAMLRVRSADLATLLDARRLDIGRRE